MGTVLMILVVLLLGICTFEDIKEKQISILSPFLVAIIVILVQVFVLDCKIGDLCSGVLVGVLLLVVSLITRGKVGIGDGMLVCITGLTYGFWENLEMLYYALLMAAVVSVILLLLKRCTKKTSFPFVPFLFGSYLITSIWR